jgi:hypothetical protein
LLVFLRQVTRAYPTGDLHLVMDNYARCCPVRASGNSSIFRLSA